MAVFVDPLSRSPNANTALKFREAGQAPLQATKGG